MTDNFALLGEPRRPWLEADPLKEKFLALSAVAHPDRIHSLSIEERTKAARRYAELNAAYACLRDPRERLRHWLELELGGKPPDVQEIPPDLAAWFTNVAALLRQTDLFVAECLRVSSPLLRVQCFERQQEWTERLTAARRELERRGEVLLQKLRDLDRDLAVRDARKDRVGLIAGLVEIHRLLSFVGKWTAQIQERLVRLATS